MTSRSRRSRVGGGTTNRSSGPTPRPSARLAASSSRRTSPRWEAGNRLDKRLGLPHAEALAVALADPNSSAAPRKSTGNPLSRRTSPRWDGGNRGDKKRGTLASSGSQSVLGTNSSLRGNVTERSLLGSASARSLSLAPTARSVQSTSRSDAMRIFIGVNPKDATVKHDAHDPLAWYAPSLSMVAPNKTVWLDQNEAARLKRHKTRSDLLQTCKTATVPHISYDIDGDGIVNQDDLKVARMVDPQGLGVLDEAGTLRGKKLLAKKYLDFNQDERWFKHIAPDIAAMSREDAVDYLASTKDFAKVMFKLRLKERPGNGTGGRGSRAALVEVDHGWASSKEERAPKIVTAVRTSRREGARERQARTRSELFSTRKRLAIKHNQDLFEAEPVAQDFRRLDLITIPKAWTRCSNTSKGFLKHLYEHERSGGGAAAGGGGGGGGTSRRSARSVGAFPGAKVADEAKADM